MTDESEPRDAQLLTSAQLRTPRAAAYAGIVFAVLTIVWMMLLQTSLPADPPTDPRWLTDDETRVTVAVTLVPFAAIAFLWFIGVLRDLLGRREDQFFGTVFFGSGLLFVAGVFVWVGVVAAALVSSNAAPDRFAESTAYVFAGSMIEVLGTEVILRMFGVFMFSSATMWARTRVMPRWLVIVTYVGALVLLIGGPVLGPVRMAIPVWVLVVSLTILIVRRRIAADLSD